MTLKTLRDGGKRALGREVPLEADDHGRTPQALTSEDSTPSGHLTAEVQAQQSQIAANQAQIDSKLATLAEAIRVARIYASRSGGH